jgi:hypothetical protein
MTPISVSTTLSQRDEDYVFTRSNIDKYKSGGGVELMRTLADTRYAGTT